MLTGWRATAPDQIAWYGELSAIADVISTYKDHPGHVTKYFGDKHLGGFY